MILALFDMGKSEVHICRAGHNKAIISSNGSMEYLHSAGIGLGLERGPIFENHLEEIRRTLKGNELFLFYSDGLTEAMNERRQQFGEDAICSLIAAVRAHPAGAIQQSILTAVKEFQGTAEQHDDVTIVVVKTH